LRMPRGAASARRRLVSVAWAVTIASLTPRMVRPRRPRLGVEAVNEWFPNGKRAFASVRGANHLERDVVAVLSGVEDTPVPIGVPWVRKFGSEEAILGRITIRDVDAGDLVVAVVLAEAGRHGACVECRRGVASFREPAQGLVLGLRVVLRH